MISAKYFEVKDAQMLPTLTQQNVQRQALVRLDGFMQKID